MAEAALPIEVARAQVESRERFLSLGRAIGLAVFVLFSLTLIQAVVDVDGFFYFRFLRRLFGVQTPAVAYQFGSAFWTAPFWLASQLIATRGQFDHYHAGEVATAVASNAAVL